MPRPRVLLFHWNESEAERRLERLYDSGYHGEAFHQSEKFSLRALGADLPQLYLIDLSRLPSHGRAVAIALRQGRKTRQVPIVFLEGAKEKVEMTKQLVPDAIYSSWTKLDTAMKRALTHPPRLQAVPRTISAYAASPLPKKLGIKAGRRVVLIGAPARFAAKLEPLPEGASIAGRGAKQAEIGMLFARTEAELKNRFESAVKVVADGMLWIVWPKQSSPLARDLTMTVLRDYCLARGWVDFKVCAVDQDWSGLCFSRKGKNSTTSRTNSRPL